jgi:hypothetical protein
LELLWTAGLVLDAFERFVAGVFAVALGVATPVGRDALAAVALELVVAAGGCTQKKYIQHLHIRADTFVCLSRDANEPSNKFIFRSTYGNSIVCNIFPVTQETSDILTK